MAFETHDLLKGQLQVADALVIREGKAAILTCHKRAVRGQSVHYSCICTAKEEKGLYDLRPRSH